MFHNKASAEYKPDANTENKGQKAIKKTIYKVYRKQIARDRSKSFHINNYFKCKWIKLFN